MGRLATAVLVALALTACGQRRDLGGDEPQLIAWWVEDVTHGRARGGGELEVVGASQGLTRITLWARGPDAAKPELPRPLARRRDRWTTIRALIGDGVIASDPTTGGLVLTRASQASGDRALAEQLVRAENADRDAIDVTVLTFGRADDTAARAYRHAVHDARRALDHASAPDGSRPADDQRR